MVLSVIRCGLGVLIQDAKLAAEFAVGFGILWVEPRRLLESLPRFQKISGFVIRPAQTKIPLVVSQVKNLCTRMTWPLSFGAPSRCGPSQF